jgi:CBS domain-containing protein
MTNKSESSARKATKPRARLVTEVAHEEPKPLQAKSSVQDAGEKIRKAQAHQLPVVSGDRLVGAVEGDHPERKAAGFGHDPETTLVRGIMVKQISYCFEHQSVDEAQDIMRKQDLQYLPVVDGNMRVIGMVGLRDLVVPKR